MKKILIGLIGPIGGGKGLAVEHIIKKFKFKSVILGDLVREDTKKEKLELTRENLRAIAKKYRKKYGRYYLINRAVKRLKNSKKGLIDGLRMPDETLKAKKLGTKIILIDAKPRLRFERTKKRARVGFSKTFKQFQKENKEEAKIYKFNKTFKYAEHKILNNKGKKEFFRNIDKLFEKLLKK